MHLRYTSPYLGRSKITAFIVRDRAGQAVAELL
jgi:hypothetical protein